MNTAAEIRFLAYVAGSASLAGSPDAADQVRRLIAYSTSTDQTAALIGALFDVLVVAVESTTDRRRATARLESRAGVIAEVLAGLDGGE